MADPTPGPATPTGDPAAPPYGIADLALEPGLFPDEMAETLAFLPEEIDGLPQAGTSSDSRGATVVYVDDTDPNAPRFGMIVAVAVAPAADAGPVIATLQRERWGDPALHTVTGSGDGAGGAPAFRLFSRTFDPAQFAIPHRPVFFLLWYRANDDYAFMVIAHSPAAREALTRALVAALA